jgi:hypothetical protein
MAKALGDVYLQRTLEITEEGEGENKTTKKILTDSKELAEEGEKFANYINDINWNSSIRAVKKIKRDMKSTNSETKNFAILTSTAMRAAGYDSAASQMSELAQSEGWGEIENSLIALYESTGEITSDAVREAAEEYGLLGEMLENGQINAAGFAAIMEEVAEGELSLVSITKDLAAAYAKMYRSVDMAGDVLTRMSKVKIRTSGTKVADTIQEAW